MNTFLNKYVISILCSSIGLLAFALITMAAVYAKSEQPSSYTYSATAAGHSFDSSLTLLNQPLTLTLQAGTGFIRINCKTGEVTLPKGMKLDDAAVAFWLRVGQVFPEVREAILSTTIPRTTTTWGEDYVRQHQMFPGEPTQLTKFHFALLQGSRGGAAYELGLRSDGVIVWREVKP